ncbi:unnamed protein product, partial [Brenthis ino]
MGAGVGAAAGQARDVTAAARSGRQAAVTSRSAPCMCRPPSLAASYATSLFKHGRERRTRPIGPIPALNVTIM